MEVQRGIRTNIQELDVIRALHQTVVSLRSALEASRSELKDLRQKYESRVEASPRTETVDNLASERIVSEKSRDLHEDTNIVSNTTQEEKTENVKKVTFNLKETDEKKDLRLTKSNIDSENTNVKQYPIAESDKIIKTNNKLVAGVDASEERHNKEVLTVVPDVIDENRTQSSGIPCVEEVIIKNEETTVTETHGEFETKVELESKFDVTIKVAALKSGDNFPIILETNGGNDIVNIHKSENVENNSQFGGESKTSNVVESFKIIHDETFIIDTSNCNSVIDKDKIMAGSKEGSVNRNDDRLNIHVKITSEEDLLMESEHVKENNPDNLNAEPDDISVRSISEGDNSVFSENVPGDGGTSKTDKTCDQENMSGNESEEVDDIELIFTTDDTKELSGFQQEDLVSISEGENWTRERSDTPILLRFNLINPEVQLRNHPDTDIPFQLPPMERSTDTNPQKVFRNRRGILRKDAFGNDPHVPTAQDLEDIRAGSKYVLLRSSSSKNYLETAESKNVNRKSFESNESFSFDNPKSYSFDNTKSSSFERESSIDAESRELSFDHRDESVDQFDTVKTTMKTQYTVCVETDISKCGVPDEEGLSESNNVRRNTCPNPFQYRPLSHREVFRGGARPLLAPPGPRAPRRSSAAQTHISALPTQWRSDTHLSKKTLPLALTTLPSKVRVEDMYSGAAVPTSRSLRSSRKSEEARRVLLSDIGFTSMVPELSRSAEPIWAGLGPSGGPLCCAQHASCLASVPCSPTSPNKQECGHSRYWSKSSMQHSFSGKLGDLSSGPNKVGYLEQGMRWRGSLPELRPITVRCGGSRISRLHMGDSEDSTDELLDEADRFLTSSIGCLSIIRTQQDEFCPSQYSRPYLPSGPRQLRLGHLVKVITPHGRIALGKVKYVGVAGGPWSGSGSAPTYVGLQVGKGVALGASGGDGSFRGRRYFHCEQGRSLFVPFSKVVMAWADY